MTGKLTVNMTVNGVGYYRHEMGQPVIKNMEVSLFIFSSTDVFMILLRDVQSIVKTTMSSLCDNRYMLSKPGTSIVLHTRSLLRCSQIKGSTNFSICVKNMMPLDVADHFRGTVSIWASVTSTDGSRQTTFDDSTPVHKQLIDIKYSKDTRKQFKPGLPYKGKVSQQRMTSVNLIIIIS